MIEEGDSLRYELFICAEPDTVFDFLVEPEAMKQWFGIAHVLEARPDGIFRVEVSPGYVALGKYTLVERPRRVCLTWGWEEAADPAMRSLGPGASLIDIVLEPKGGGTLLVFTQSRLPPSASKRHGARWQVH